MSSLVSDPGLQGEVPNVSAGNNGNNSNKIEDMTTSDE
jgi:hypothetical protein